VKRIIIATVIAVTVVAAVAVATASGASATPTSAVITFDDMARQVTLQIPDPPCDSSEPGCVWKFFLNEPKVSVDVAIVYGTSGTLTIPYPPNFCGILQADAYVGPTANGPWVSKRGWQHQIAPVGDCEPPTPPSGGGTDTPPGEPPPPAATPVVPAPAPTPVPQAAAVAPVVAAATAAPTTTTTAPAKPAAAPASLPFTGANLGPFVVLGLTLVTLGLCLVFLRRKRTL
jgi:LPXTG-motif cell wall-anchored protein